MPHASKTLLPNQNGHHASPAMNAHNRARSTIALSLESLCAFEILAVEASAGRASNKDCTAIGSSEDEPSVPTKSDRDSASELRHVTTVWVNRLFSPSSNGAESPLKGTCRFTRQLSTRMARFDPYRRSF
jgi:hypothetical protein